MQYVDYYEILGIVKTATEKEIKQAYRKLARKHHPDLHQGDAKKQAEEKFKQINEAYEVLGDPGKRAKYDKLGMNWQTGDEVHFDPSAAGGYTYSYQGNEGFDPSEFSNFFASIFGQEFNHGQPGGRRTRTANYKGEDINAEIQLSVIELIQGAEKDLHLSAPQVCTACAGQRFSQHGICQTCGGAGVTEIAKTVKVKIPAGLYPGASLRLKGLGGRGSGTSDAGDLYLHIQVGDPTWQVNGRDLETELTLYPEQAVLGDRVKVATPHGPVQLKIEPGTHSGQRLRLKNKGLPQKQGLGDLYLKIRIDIPQNLPETEKALYRKIRDGKVSNPHESAQGVA
ncbi:DnaJ C-terminal domain-containing protein [Sporomusa aerivorans]|uniref:DnaJ C-terminal domain-containing protein n=1 Tax=Sporomusa aerivorans TaxID=204936 RepID=UPI00352B0078